MPTRRAGHVRAPGDCVLDFTEDAVRLLHRDPERGLTEIGTAPLNQPDFATRIESLRVEHLVRTTPGRPVALRLPPEQIVARRFQLHTKDDAASEEARSRLAQDIGQPPEELLVAIGPVAADGLFPVLGALRQTASEAADYARRWGFRPGPVVSAVAFGPEGLDLPVLKAPSTLSTSLGRLAHRAARGSVAAALLVAAGVAAAHYGPALIAGVSSNSQRLGTAGLVAPSADRSGLLALNRGGALGPARPGSLSAGARLEHPNGSSAASRPVLPPDTRLTLAAAPVTLIAPGSPSEVTVGASLDPTTLARPARLPPPALPDSKPSVNVAIAEVQEPSLLAETLPADPVPETELQLASAAGLTAQPPENDADLVLISGVEEEDLTPTAQAPNEMAEIPLPRPEQAPVAEAAVPPPAPTPAPAPSQSPSLVRIAPTDGTAQEQPSAQAVVEAPPPPARPKRLATRYLAESKPPATQRIRRSGPLSIRQAADRDGLLLDRTSLLGVMQASDGRLALVRTPEGDFRKVSRGDVIDGWRVTSIGRTAVRLTRQGQNRTLLLVGN